MHELSVLVKLTIACTVSYLTTFIDMYGIAITIVFISIGFDWLTALIAAAINKEVSSSKGHKGFYKKMLLLTLLAFGVFLDWAFPCLVQMMPEDVFFTKLPDLPIGAGVAGYITLNEWISILENFDKAGMKIPSWLRNMIAIAKGRQK